MERLGDMKRLKRVEISNRGTELSFEDAHFYLDCTMKTTADVLTKFQGSTGEVNLRDMNLKYKKYKATFTKEEREFFSHVFPYDQD